MKKYKWKLLDQDIEVVKQLRSEIRVSEPIAKALYNRGIVCYNDAESFFVPTKKSLHDPFLMKSMDIASRRVSRAVDQKEKIVVYGDYDVDGTTSTALLVTFLRKQGANVTYYVNDRETEGYGVSTQGIEYAKEYGANLIITVDCGISSLDESNLCKRYNLDLVICDHHQPGEKLPHALAILNPKQTDCNYPFKELSGCGVVFKLICAICVIRNLEYPYDYLDYTALATAADIVPLSGENRILMHEGIKMIKANQRLFIKMLSDVSGTDLENITVEGIVFKLAPRINAAGRLVHAKKALLLMLTDKEDEALSLALDLNELNRERQEIQRDIVSEAISMAESILTSYPSSITVYNSDWHLGVLGIVASKLVEKFYLPTIVISEKDGLLKGSARSVPGLNIFNALKLSSSHVIQFGGHEMAGGLTMKIDELESFRKMFDRVSNDLLKDGSCFPSLIIDAEISLQQITAGFLKTIKRFEPCGPGNRHPVFVIRHVPIKGTPQLLKGEHLKFRVMSSQNVTYNVIGFGLGKLYYDDLIQMLSRCKRDESIYVDLVVVIEENRWNGNITTQLRAKDIRIV